MFRKLTKKVAIALGVLPQGGPSSGRSKLAPSSRLAFEPLEARLVLDSTVVFNEIMYNPAGGTDATLEWIELYNQLTVDMDISEWSIEGGIDFQFPDKSPEYPNGTVVPGRGFLVLAISPQALEAETGYAGAYGPFTGRLSNGGEELRLVNNDGRVMNVVDYDDGGDWPVAPDGSGASLAKLDPKSASEPAENWTFSSQVGGTPGEMNFPFQDPGDGVTETLLATGAPVRALVPPDDTLGLTWTQPAFSESTWTSGTTGVGYERSSGYDPVLGLDLDSPPGGQPSMPMYDVNETVYVRVGFDVDRDPLQFDSLSLEMKYDDGFVAYLNGVEVAHANAPGRDGNTDPLEWDSGATRGHESSTVDFERFDVTTHRGLLVQGGDNVLAIHGLNDGARSTDMLVLPELVGVRPLLGNGAPLNRYGLVFNEVPSARDADFWVEVANLGTRDLELEGFVLTATSGSGGDYVFPAQTIRDGEFLAIAETELGFHPDNDEKLYLYAPGQAEVLDARGVTNRLRGRSEEHDGRWLYPDAPTPDAANTFAFHEEIVINEIMYHAFPKLATETEPFEDSPEQWIELYNRGTTSVDLDGWKFEDAIDYEFPSGTIIQPGGYLVVAKDADELAAKYPEIDIVGDYSRSLSNVDDRILLIDASENPADEVHYYEYGRWPEYADGGGSTLELRNPLADNSKAEAWAASDEASKSSWNTYSYTKIATEPLQIGQANNYHEYIFCLLDSGEFLIDDISVKRGGTTEMMQNGLFSDDLDHWRLNGNHTGSVQFDPDDPGNKVLHLVANGPYQIINDYVSTTFVGNTPISSGSEYTISFRAKWLGGNNQINNRLYVTRAGYTVQLEVPEQNGTPGEQNSTFEANLGPTYSDFGHYPILPGDNEPVTVSVRAEDPDGVDSVGLKWKYDGGIWNTEAMTLGADGLYTATIAGRPRGNVVQFYVLGTDGADPAAASTYPAAGVNSRALYKVDDLQQRPIDTYRLVLLGADNTRLIPTTSGNDARNMTNKYVGMTLIYNDEEAFYDVEVRQVGSRWIRPNSGYKVRLHPDHRLYGVHGSIRFDFSGGGTTEIYMKQMVNRAGGSSVSLYDDIAYMITPRHTRTTLFQLARYEDVFLNEQFVDGSDGTKWELDDIVFPMNPVPAPEGVKTYAEAVTNQDIRYRGDDPEAYRGQLLIKSNRAKDAYDKIAELAWAINRPVNPAPGEIGLYEATQQVMDVDLWMRHYATQAFLGNWDTYGFGRPKNLRIYLRPEDQKLIPLYWDADLANLTEALIYNSNSVTRLDDIRDLPGNLRLFWGHMWDLVDRSFNPTYIGPWIQHYNTLGAGINYNTIMSRLQNRVNQARSQAQSAIRPIGFQIITNNFSVHDVVATIEGTGWINVREIRLAGSDEPLDVTWVDNDSWQATLVLGPGANDFTVEAHDFRGNLLATDSITITSTIPNRPLEEFLRITELNYNPADPTPQEWAQGFTDNDQFEFVELQNISNETLDMSKVRFTNGIDFEFTGVYEGAPVLITEVGTGDADFVEIQNISGRSVDTSGWFVVVNDAYDIGHDPDINAWMTTLWNLPDAMAPDELLYATDIPDGVGYDWGASIFWRTMGSGWAMLADDHGNVADFVVWGYSPGEIASLALDVGGFHLTAEGAWSDGAVVGQPGENETFHRGGEADHNDASDWHFEQDSRGLQNEDLPVPFPSGPFLLSPGELVVIGNSAAALETRYGNEIRVADEYSLKLENNNGERITLVSPFGAVIADFQYDDDNGWPGRADGKGASLELIDPTALPQDPQQRVAYLQNPDNWRSSSEYGGSPGFQGTGPLNDVVVNEVLTHTDPPDRDSIELYNTTGEGIDVSGWYLSDDWGWDPTGENGNYRKFRIPDDTVIPAYGYVVFDEDDFNPTWNDPDPQRGPNDFALDGAHGDDVWLMGADADGKLTRFVDHVDFPAQAAGESWGRWPDWQGRLYPMIATTLEKEHPENGKNSGPRVGPLILSEVHYHPDHVNADDLEFVEIYNPTATAVNLTDWRIRQDIDFDFPRDTTLDARSALVVVAFDVGDAATLAAFRNHYGLVDPSVLILGGYSGLLNDDGGRVQLQRPDTPPEDEPGFIPHLLEDEVIYDDEGDWPTAPDGHGSSLNRSGGRLWGHDSTSWNALPPSPGSAEIVVEAQVVGRHVFYNRSSFDGNNPLAGPEDDNAIAPDKEALRPGETATFVNYTSYSRGINGVIIDVADLAGQPTIDDFTFKLGNSNDPDNWASAPGPNDITLRQGEGQNNTDRVTILWDDNVIQKQWLQVTVLVTPNTGLVEPDVFYFGNALGETGNSTTDAKVNAFDMLGARDNQRTFLNPATIDFEYDFNRDARVNTYDMLTARDNQTHFLNALKLITVPGGGKATGQEAAEVARETAHDAVLTQAVDREPGRPTASLVELDWLYELEPTHAKQWQSAKTHATEAALEELLATAWR